jgi:hypothetical protein
MDLITIAKHAMCCLGSLLVVVVDIDVRVERRSELSRGTVCSGPVFWSFRLVLAIHSRESDWLGSWSSLYGAGKK